VIPGFVPSRRARLPAIAVAGLLLGFAAAAETPSASGPPASSPVAAPIPAGTAQRRALYVPALIRWAALAGIPAELADAVAVVESAYEPRAVGSSGEVGLMQVMPATAAMLGFRGGVEALMEPDTNLRYGTQYLAGAWRLSGGDLCWTLARYRAGHGEQRMTPRSVDYCRRAVAHLAWLGSPLAAVAMVPAAPPAPGPAREPVVAAPPPLPPLLRRVEEERQRFQAMRDARLRLVRSEMLASAGSARNGLLQRWPGLRPPP